MQPSIGEKVIGPATPARPHSPSNRHHQLDLPAPAPPTKQISDDSTVNVLQLNANGIGNKLTELEVVLERNKVKVAVIQESKLSPKSKNPASRMHPMPNEPRPCYKVSLSSMYSQRHKLQVHQMLWMGAHDMLWNLKCSPVSEKKVVGLATPARPHSPSNRHHQLDLPLPLRLPNRSVMTARSTSYSSTLTESGTS